MKNKILYILFIENEKKTLIDFFSNFNVIGLAITSVIGLASSSL